MSLLLAALKKTEQIRSRFPQEAALNSADDARMAGKKLFTAKNVRKRPTLGVIPLAILIGLLLAAGGGYYVWREISPPPQVVRQAVTQPTQLQPTPLARQSPGKQSLAVQSPRVQSLAVQPLAVAEQPQSENLAEQNTVVAVAEVAPTSSSERVAKIYASL